MAAMPLAPVLAGLLLTGVGGGAAVALLGAARRPSVALIPTLSASVRSVPRPECARSAAAAPRRQPRPANRAPPATRSTSSGGPSTVKSLSRWASTIIGQSRVSVFIVITHPSPIGLDVGPATDVRLDRSAAAANRTRTA